MRFLFLLFYLTTFAFFSCGKAGKHFSKLTSSETKINFSNIPEKRKGLSILYYLYYYNGGGVATGDINNDGLPDIYFTANSKGNNKLYLNKGNFQFEDITDKAGVAGLSDWCTGVTMADVNADGWLDIYVCSVQGEYDLKGHNQLFINNRNGTFTESASQFGLDLAAFSTQAAFLDYDRDGDLDCYILNQSHHPNENIADTSKRRKIDPLAGDRLYRNDVNVTGKFTDVSAEAGVYQGNLGYGLGIAISDINNDGWDDIYIGNDFHENDYYYINTGKGNFVDGSYVHFNHFSRFSMGNDVADYDNDGQLDIVTVDMLPPEEKVLKNYGSDESPDVYNYKIAGKGYQYQYSRNNLQHNNGDGESFSDVALSAGMAATDWSWSALLNDFDNDGNKDLFITSGIVKRPMDLDYVRFVSDLSVRQAKSHAGDLDDIALEKSPDGASYCYLFGGDGMGGFSDRSKNWGIGEKKGYYNGASYADLDNDGDLDIVVNALNSEAVIYRNNTTDKNYLSIKFTGDSLNTSGIGAKAYLFTNGKLQYQELMATRGFQSASDIRLHFGLDSLKKADSILIVWPCQQYQVLHDVAVNQQLIIKKQEASGVFDYESYFPKKKQLLEDISNQVSCEWSHKENRFTDFNTQYLIPHEQSTRGPKIAVGDVNGDGLEDIYVCGAKDQGGSLLLQMGDGKFVASDIAMFNYSKTSEGVDAVFFDADGDGDLDLYVVSGGNEYADGDPALADHLYINDGKGKFGLTLDALPQILVNKSTVSVSDIDKDGDADIFIGGLADAKKYGYPQSSYLLINDGKGKYKVAEERVIKLKQIGIVTTSAFSDVNGDGWADLIVTGEWMGVKIYLNEKGLFKATEIPQSSGLWQTVYPADVNGDGHMDILAGNWGENTKLKMGKNGPVKLYVKDFDRNGSVEQVMCYTIDGQEYTFLPKDELEKTIPVLKKGYLTYNEVAGKTVQYLLDDLFKDYLELKAEVLSSSCFIGDGKGGFTKKDLPRELQLAPLFSFASLDSTDKTFIAGGNFYGVLPYEGRYDAMRPVSFSFASNGQFKSGSKLPVLQGEVRDIKWIRKRGNEKIAVIAINNKGLTFYKK